MSGFGGPRGRIHGNPGRAQFKFSEAQLSSIQRSVFDRSHGHSLTFGAGYLTPVLVDEVLPGDTFNLRMTAMCRMLSPLLAPLMSNMYLETFWFFVPNRIVWDNWEKFMGAQDNPADSTSFIVPSVTVPVAGIAVGDLADYFGLTTGIASLPNPLNALPFRGANLIWNTWFRDENLQNSRPVPTGNGPDTYTDYVLQRRGKRKDYFTSCLPWTQKINDGTVVNIGLGGTAPVQTTGASFLINNGAGSGDRNVVFGAALTYSGGVVAGNAEFGAVTGLQADLSAATGISINAFRQAIQLQRLFERDARGGTRYVELLWSHFGVRSPDFRLQRPELLSTGYSPMNIHPVPQTSASGLTGDTTKQGNLAAFATGSVHGHGFTKSFVEHGYVFGFVCVRADLSYYQGVPKMWTRSTRYDFYWPTLAHIGEQAVLNQEIYLTTNAPQNAAVFGYTGRYNEYRFKPSQLSGLMQPGVANSIAYYNLAQQFGSLPTLGDTFIVENPPTSRVKALPALPDFVMDCDFKYRCARPMSVDAIPGWVDHF